MVLFTMVDNGHKEKQPVAKACREMDEERQVNGLEKVGRPSRTAS